jgi:Glycerol uptake facilitator and related permeases (Major Intrinsic Protein Family)
MKSSAKSIASWTCKPKSSRLSQSMGKKLIAEFLGTFCLVFAGTGAIVIDSVTGGAVSHVGVALTFGLIVLAMIYTIGDISGAHINPAVTIGFFAARRFEAGSVIPYVACQCGGALVASCCFTVFVSPKRDTWSDGAGRFGDAIVRARDDSDNVADVCDP